MWIDDDEYFVRCGCGDIRHPVCFIFNTGHFDGIPYLELVIGLTQETTSFWMRIKNALLYILKEKKFWHWGEISLTLTEKKQRDEIEGLIKFLNSALIKADQLKTEV